MGLFSGISNYLFGSDRVETQDTKQQAFNEQQIARQYQAREAQDYAHQLAMSQYLNRVIAGQTAPSVASTQLTAGLNQVQQAGNAAAAGGTGVNAGLNQYANIIGGGQLMAQTNQQVAQLKAQEQAAAAMQQGQLLSNMGARSGALQGANANLGLDYSQLLANQQTTNQAQQNKEQAAALQGIGAAGATVLGGPAAGAAVSRA